MDKVETDVIYGNTLVEYNDNNYHISKLQKQIADLNKRNLELKKILEKINNEN